MIMLKEPRRFVAIIILFYTIYVSLLLVDHFTERRQDDTGKITGMSSVGTVSINIQGVVSEPEAGEEHKKKAEEPPSAETPLPEQQPIIPAVLLVPLPLGEFGADGVLQFVLGIGDSVEFMYEGQMHKLTLMDANSDSVTIELTSEPTIYAIPFHGATGVDMDLDGVDDVVATVDKTDNDKFIITLTKIKHPAIQAPSGIGLLKSEMQKIKNIALALSGIIALLLFISFYGYKNYIAREIKVDKTLKVYVQAALEKGFIEPQIRAKLIENGFDAEEVDYVLRHLKNSIPNKK